MSKRVLLLCPHPEGVAPGQRLKYEQYLEYFRENGYEVTVSPFMTRRFWDIVYLKGHYVEKILWTIVGYLSRLGDLARLPFYDGAYVFLWVTPFGTSFFERIARMLAKRMVYDIDDLVFLGKASAANRLVSLLKGRSKIHYLMRTADHVITCTPYLDEYVRKLNSRTTDISSTIDTGSYAVRPAHANTGNLILGWSGSHSTARYLLLLRDMLLNLSRTLEFELLVIGAPDFRMSGLTVRAIPWRLASEVTDLQQIDIGLYPLPDDEWVQGKSGLKALQYMALGIPTIASARGANFRVIEDGVSGFLVNSEAQWAEKIELLAGDPALRSVVGNAARKRVVERYSVSANRGTYLKVLDEAFG